MYSVSSSQCLSFTRFVVDPKSFFVLSTKKLVIALVSCYVPAGYCHSSSSHIAMRWLRSMRSFASQEKCGAVISGVQLYRCCAQKETRRR